MPAWVPLNVDLESARYRGMFGVGGIGGGTFFALDGNHTLGREESRSGRFLDRRDYCKLHIITHYVQTLLGPGFKTLPIGKVGDDETGRQMLAEMSQTGMDLRYVQILPGEQTLYSLCFVYPDGTGGNLTTADSANARLSPQDVESANAGFAEWHGRGIALAAPEVSLQARRALLQLATRFGFYRVLAVNSAEARSPLLQPMLAQVDLLALNLDEAVAFSGAPPSSPPQAVVERTVERLAKLKADLNAVGVLAAITAGKRSSWTWDGEDLRHYPAVPVDVVSTAGAGDAFLAGLIVGQVAGLSLFQAQEFAALLAALSITSPHTIHPGIDRTSLRAFALQSGIRLSGAVQEMLGL